MKIFTTFSKWIGILLISILCNFCVHAQAIQKIDWHKDLNYLKNELPILHSNLFFQYPQASYESDIESLKKQIGGISDETMFIKIQQLLSKLGDSHTTSNFLHKLQRMYLPIVLETFDEGIFIVGTIDIDENIMGNKLISINGHPLKSIIDSVKTLYVAENESWHKRNVTNYLINYDILKYFGFVDKEKVKLQMENYYGIPYEKTVRSIHVEDIDRDEVAYLRFSGRKNKRPRTTAIFGQKYLPKDSLYFVTYNRCTGRENEQMLAIQDSLNIDMNEFCTTQPKKDKKSKEKTDVKPLPFFRHFRDSVFQAIKNQPVKKLVFDLSRNGGGTTAQGTAMIEKLAQMIDTTKTKVYVIVGRRTFSAAIIHTMELKRLLNATIVGEPTGGKPSFYGGVDTRYLPSSCLQIRFSRSHRKTSLDEDVANANTIIPDVLFPVTLASVTSGTDAIYDWILKQ
ncbi:MAG TPA: S41 family peptidase [Saprospiraceae bacterium]|nr:S41 family peptidase [Saprospiraceae bacterium]